MKKFIIPLIACCLIFGCDPVDDRIVINNKRSERIFYVKSPFNTLAQLYDNIREQQGVNMTVDNSLNSLSSGMETHLIIFGNGNAWKRYIAACEDKTLKLFVFSQSDISHLSLFEIAQQQKYEVVKLTIEDLERMNWRITLE